jgi:Rod binding domain-containing protein
MSADLSLNALRSDASQTWANQPVPSNVTDPETYKAARGFEAYFARYLVSQLKGEMDLIGGKGYGGDTYQEMYVEAISSEIAAKGALGITEMMYRQLMTQKGQEPFKETNGALNPLLETEAPRVHKPPLPEQLVRYHSIVREAASKYDVDEELLYAVMQQESAGKPDAVSHAGAKGLMQLIDSTAAEMGVQDSFDPRENIMGGAKYLRQQLDTFGSVEHALAAYNAGPGAVMKYSGVPPYRETTNYVEKVTGHYERLKRLTEAARTRVSEYVNEQGARLRDLAMTALSSTGAGEEEG